MLIIPARKPIGAVSLPMNRCFIPERTIDKSKKPGIACTDLKIYQKLEYHSNHEIEIGINTSHVLLTANPSCSNSSWFVAFSWRFIP